MYKNNLKNKCLIAVFRREVDKDCGLLGAYAATSGKFLTDVLGQPIGPIFRGQESKINLGFIVNKYKSLR
jgi:hypothetical protein